AHACRPPADEAGTIEFAPALVRDDLQAIAAALHPGEDGPGEEQVPEPVPTLAIRPDHPVAVLHPVLVPAMDGHAVVDVDVLHAADLESGLLELCGHEREGKARVGARVDVLGHEHRPGGAPGSARWRIPSACGSR